MAIAPDRFEWFAAIDWSGAVGARQKGIAVAICGRGRSAPAVVRAGHVWSRADVTEWLTHALPDRTLVGLDLGVSLPFVDRGAYFPGWPESPPDAHALWRLVETICVGDPHLAVSAFVDHDSIAPHFRRHGNRKGAFFEGSGRLRQTEIAQREQGLNPYSNLNLVGAAQVGKSSLTGMRVLQRVQGILPIWPFDATGSGSLVVEIYTSIAAIAAGRAKGRTKMTSIAALNDALKHPAIDSLPIAGEGPIDDHTSDAILTAAWLRRNADSRELWAPPAMTPHVARTEGWTFGVR